MHHKCPPASLICGSIAIAAPPINVPNSKTVFLPLESSCNTFQSNSSILSINLLSIREPHANGLFFKKSILLFDFLILARNKASYFIYRNDSFINYSTHCDKPVNLALKTTVNYFNSAFFESF